jgi:hypothetical protein
VIKNKGLIGIGESDDCSVGLKKNSIACATSLYWCEVDTNPQNPIDNPEQPSCGDKVNECSKGNFEDKEDILGEVR